MTSDPDSPSRSAERIAALPLPDRAAAFGEMLEDLRRDLEADGRE